MLNTGKLSGLTVFISGASRGIGKAIALKVAKDGANVVIAAKTAEPHPKLPGTIYTAAKEVEEAGGKSLACVLDVRNEQQVREVVQTAVKTFGGIDILVNNASAISLTGTADTDMKRYDLMQNINTRGTFLLSKECLPYLQKSKHAHILTLSPPLNMNPRWFQNNVAYTISKYGMSMCVLGMHEEFRPLSIAVNALWPRTAIDTAAIRMLSGNESSKFCRKPEIIADAAYHILCQSPTKVTGQFLIDDEVLKEAGITDFDQYCVSPEHKNELMLDFFLDPQPTDGGSFIRVTKNESTPTAQTDKNANEDDSGDVAKLFRKIEASLSEEVVKRTQAVFQFEVTGKEAGKWFIDLKEGAGSCGRGDSPKPPDATLTMDSKNFFAMFTGKLKPATAFMMGKLKIKGNLQLALKLEKLMSSLKSKL